MGIWYPYVRDTEKHELGSAVALGVQLSSRMCGARNFHPQHEVKGMSWTVVFCPQVS